MTAHEGTGGPEHHIHFQCLVDAHSENVIGYEALARFADGVAPDERLARARAAGRLRELELTLMRSAVEASHVIPSDLLVTINASATTIASAELDGMLPGGRRWGLELAETSEIDPDGALRRRVADLGALLLIDDAGSQHACIEWISILRPEIVKIDKSVVWAACDRRAARRQLDQFVAASRQVGAKTLAEGVESDLHARVITEAGIDYAQGFRYGLPAAFAA
ncbi:EAL domain-containing protein [Microbacterium paludicola]|uniref:EAL domain-containing protein n=1 Tax=Microbacterium paludicola TaxID=300019 RepID=UPI00387A09AC